MSATGLAALSPLWVLAAGILWVLGSIAVHRSRRWTVGSTLAVLAVSLSLLPWVQSVAPYRVGDLLILDAYAFFFIGLILAAAVVVTAMSGAFLKRLGVGSEEYYVLLLSATLGAAVLVASRHFVTLFLGLELLSVSLYVLIAYSRVRLEALEASLKYLVLTGASSAVLVFGAALVYSELGTLELVALEPRMAELGAAQLIVWVGLAMLIAGVGFKMAVVPFHMWTPDVYQGAPAPVGAYMATVSKGAVLALLLRYLVTQGAHTYTSIVALMALLSVASILVGNLLALRQDNIKRILAYSSIAHLGYLLLPLIAAGEGAAGAVSFYLVAYFVTTLGAFGVVAATESGDGGEWEELSAYRGLFWRQPALALVLSLAVLSLAGIPLTAGFIGKFVIIAAGARAELWGPLFVLVAGSVLGLFYYLRIVAVLFQGADRSEQARWGVPLPAAGLALAVLTLILLWIGIQPSFILNMVETAVRSIP
jgi:NADH-quinone oxidoreductase subunit N